MDHENQVTFLERTHLHAPERNFVSRVLFPKLRTESNEDRGYRFKVGEEEKIEEFEWIINSNNERQVSSETSSRISKYHFKPE